MADIPHVIILGAGFGGIGALKKLRDANMSHGLVLREPLATAPAHMAKLPDEKKRKIIPKVSDRREITR